jgi:hypothetical protein
MTRSRRSNMIMPVSRLVVITNTEPEHFRILARTQ